MTSKCFKLNKILGFLYYISSRYLSQDTCVCLCLFKCPFTDVHHPRDHYQRRVSQSMVP